MSDDFKDKPQAPEAEQPKRRLFIFKAAAFLAAAAAVTLGTTREANADVGAGHQDSGGSHGADSWRRGRGGRRRRHRRSW